MCLWNTLTESIMAVTYCYLHLFIIRLPSIPQLLWMCGARLPTSAELQRLASQELSRMLKSLQ